MPTQFPLSLGLPLQHFSTDPENSLFTGQNKESVIMVALTTLNSVPGPCFSSLGLTSLMTAMPCLHVHSDRHASSSKCPDELVSLLSTNTQVGNSCKANTINNTIRRQLFVAIHHHCVYLSVIHLFIYPVTLRYLLHPQNSRSKQTRLGI